MHTERVTLMTPGSWQGRHCLKSQVTIFAVTLVTAHGPAPR